MGSSGLPKRVIKSCFWKEAICARLFSLLPRVSVKNRRAEFPPTDDASLCKDSERKASEVLKRSLKALAGDQKLGTFVDHVLGFLRNSSEDSRRAFGSWTVINATFVYIRSARADGWWRPRNPDILLLRGRIE